MIVNFVSGNSFTSGLSTGLLRHFFSRAIDMLPAIDPVPSFRSSCIQGFKSLIINCTVGRDSGLQNDSSHCISAEQSCSSMRITGYKTV